MTNIDVSNLTADQLDVLREVVTQADARRSENVFDLSKPPKAPYKHQEFPKALYNAEGHVITAKNAAEEAAALEDGYKNEPHPDFDYSRIDRNGMKAARVTVPAEVSAEDAAAAKGDSEEVAIAKAEAEKAMAEAEIAKAQAAKAIAEADKAKAEAEKVCAEADKAAAKNAGKKDDSAKA